MTTLHPCVATPHLIRCENFWNIQTGFCILVFVAVAFQDIVLWPYNQGHFYGFVRILGLHVSSTVHMSD